jgi:hypothetical protein
MTSNIHDTIDPSQFIGRVVRLFGLVSKPDLNDTYGNVESYVQSTNRYSVKLLNDRTNCSLKSDNFKVIKPGFNYARSKGRSLILVRTLKGNVFDVPHGDFSDPNGQIVFDYPCIVRGVRSSPGSEGNYQPKSCITSPIFIDMQNAIEFEDLNIVDIVENQTNVELLSGRAIFRRCRFSGQDSGMFSGGSTAATNCIFENCVFELCGGSGCIADSFSSVSFLNCIIRNNKGMGIEIRNGGIATISHCRFENNARPSIAGYRNGKNIDVSDCTIIGGGDSGILMSEGCTSLVRRTKISGCKMAGIATQLKGSVIIQDCDIQKCLYGLLAQTGKCIVKVTNSNIVCNQYYGLFVAEDCVGSIALDGNTMKPNGKWSLEQDSGHLCMVTLDGVVQVPNGRKYKLNQKYPAYVAKLEKDAKEALAQISPEEHHGALKIATERARKKAGLTTGVPKCASCNELEPIDEKFLRCSNCLAVLYCSKGCQKEDWKNHKKECKKRVKHARSVF